MLNSTLSEILSELYRLTRENAVLNQQNQDLHAQVQLLEAVAPKSKTE